MLNEVINVGNFRQQIKESASEFNAKLGAGVESTNKKNNDKSYKESTKKTGVKATEPKKTKELDRSDDMNCTTLDNNMWGNVSEKFKEKVKVQAQGYTSTLEKKSKTERDAEFDDDAQIYKSMKKNADARNKVKSEIEHSGIVGSKTPKKEKETMYENVNLSSPKRLIFKKTTFVNESQMLSRIPEEYKVDGQKIYMKDCKGNEYIVECRKCDYNGNVETIVLNYNNEQILNEKVNRMWELFNYDSAKNTGTFKKQDRINEEAKLGELINRARELNKEIIK
jgi:hypothetical protein